MRGECGADPNPGAFSHDPLLLESWMVVTKTETTRRIEATSQLRMELRTLCSESPLPQACATREEVENPVEKGR